MTSLKVTSTPLSGVYQIQRTMHADARGHFSRLFCVNELSAFGWPTQAAVQVNFSHTEHVGTVRGMHFQRPPHAEFKLVSCVAGEVFDVVLDLRQKSATFLQWFACTLSAENARALLIPPGFAHGFQVLKPQTSLVYAHSSAHCPPSEDGLHPLDLSLAIAWPLPVQNLSQRDQQFLPIGANFQGVDE